MGKLNYTNRKIEGSKLVAVVTRDIIKRMPANVSHKSALRDPVVEFDISDKDITDDGLREISDALIQAVKEKKEGRILVLEEVSLKGNKITCRGLAAFAPIIREASAELRNLDLSDNAIEVKTIEDGIDWERFLRSFSHCTSLRRLDLGGNKLGCKGFEILCKVYAWEEGVVVSAVTGQAKICGLQSIPYICLANTDLDNQSSISLSYILESHRFVYELLPLVPQAKPGPQAHQLELYNEVSGCNGIIWKPNPDVHGLGAKMLEAAETMRRKRRDLQDQDEDVVSDSLVDSVADVSLSFASNSASRRRSRGDSIASFDDSFQTTSSHSEDELIRSRSRLQLEALKYGGLKTNDLWSATFRILHYTRILLYGLGLDASCSTITALNDSTNIPTKETQAQTLGWPLLPARPMKEVIEPTTKILRLTRTKAQTRSALTKGDPNTAVAVREPSSKAVSIPTIKPQSRYHQTKIQQDVDILRLLDPVTRVRYLQQYRSNLPAGFPETVWIEIISFAADAEGVLSDNQKISAIRWAASRDAMMELRSVRGKHESQQTYKALAGMGCLTYGI